MKDFPVTVSIEEDLIPGLASLKVDDKGKMEINYKILNVGRSRWNDDKKIRIEIEILGGKLSEPVKKNPNVNVFQEAITGKKKKKE